MTARAESRDQGRWRWICVAALLCAILLAALALGELPLTPAEVWQAITGQASGFTETVVLSWRLPRAVASFAFGAALGAAGSIFQSLTRNPLGSPDIVGFNTGAYTGVLLALLFLPAATFVVTAGAALLGGILTACVVLLLTARGGLSGNAFVLTGIAISAMLGALNTWLTYKTDIAKATAGSIWAAGTLDNTRWDHLTPALVALAMAAAATVLVSQRLRVLALGDDIATALGLRVTRTRLALVACAVALTAITTAAAGPILFVALAAPHLARLTLPRSHPTLAATLCGALLLGAADCIAAHAFAPVQLPVGAVTVSLGGLYLAIMILLRRK